MENPLYGEHPIEMGVNDGNRKEIVARLRADPNYPRWFAAAFPEKKDPISFETIIKAISAFQRGVVSFNSRYDQYLQGKIKLTEAEQRGHDLYFGEKADCHHCHGSVNLDDQFVHAKTREAETPFHNTGLYNIDGKGRYPALNLGLMDVAGDPDDMGKFTRFTERLPASCGQAKSACLPNTDALCGNSSQRAVFIMRRCRVLLTFEER
jgi:cytochrome c peroxidase